MSGLDGEGGIGCSANNRRWACLIYLVKLLSEGKIVLDPFANGVEKPYNATFDSLVLAFKNKRKRSPRNKKVVPRSKNLEKNPPKTRRSNEKINSNDVENIATDVFFSHDSDAKKPSSKNTRKRTNCKEKEGVTKKRSKKTSDVMTPAPDLPEAFKNCILDHGCDSETVILVTQKILTGSDVNRRHYKLSVRYSKVRNKFLKPSEEDVLRNGGRVKAILLQPCMDECKISLGEWKSNFEYALVDNWNMVRRKNRLRKGMKIQLWSFRRATELCFALVRLS
ncbi:hypothetical protein CDL12_04772 [Handroanthus impetiginosus]|uniref:TF-B3 domain-containing protein n=1 Tax=Handroanthus impetiginosus TaxID=429701 RepID=A0A2G9HYC2_9LAMI|nr:hypothetical protein CDL12_04772 [Handroanthus impetiginosus]